MLQGRVDIEVEAVLPLLLELLADVEDLLEPGFAHLVKALAPVPAEAVRKLLRTHCTELVGTFHVPPGRHGDRRHEPQRPHRRGCERDPLEHFHLDVVALRRVDLDQPSLEPAVLGLHDPGGAVSGHGWHRGDQEEEVQKEQTLEKRRATQLPQTKTAAPHFLADNNHGPIYL